MLNVGEGAKAAQAMARTPDELSLVTETCTFPAERHVAKPEVVTEMTPTGFTCHEAIAVISTGALLPTVSVARS